MAAAGPDPTAHSSPSSLLAGLTSAPPESLAPQALGVLHEVILALAHESPREAVLSLVATKARLLAGCASSAVALIDGEGEFITFAAASGENAQDVKGTRIHSADSIVGNTARTGETYLSYNPAPDGANPSGQITSAAVVPIYADGHPVGALAALNKHGQKPFGGDDLMALTTLAAAASVGIVNDRLRTDSERQGRELSTLYEAVRNVSGQLSAQEVLTAAMEQVVAHIPNSAVSIFLLNDERTHFYIAADFGLHGDQREVTLTTDSGLGAAALLAGRPMFLTFTPEEMDDYFAPGAPPAQESPFPELPARSGIAAPIRTGDTTHGLILAVSNQADAYKIGDANLLSALAAQAGVAIENAWLYEDATRRAEEATTLYELSQTITSTLRLPDVLELVADSVLSLLAVDKFALFLHERSTDTLQMVVARGLRDGAEERVQPLVGQGIPGWVMEFETPTAVQDVAADHRNASSPLHTEGVVSMMCMPLQVGAATIGVLCAASARRRLFTVAEMELLYTVANQAAIAIENARNYADVHQKARELRKYFHRVARALGSSQSPGEVPEVIAGLTVEVMGADRCVLYSVSEKGDALHIEACVNFRTLLGGGEQSYPLTEETPAGWVARKARPLTIDDLTGDGRFAEGLARITRSRVTSYLGVPLRLGRNVIGVLEVYTRAPRRWRSDEVRLLLTFASQATVAFQNARLAAESGRAARDARLLRRLFASLAEGVDLSTVTTVIGQEIDAATAIVRRNGDGGWSIQAEHQPDKSVGSELERRVAELPAEPATTDDLLFVGAGDLGLAVLPGETPPHLPLDVLTSAIRLLKEKTGEETTR